MTDKCKCMPAATVHVGMIIIYIEMYAGALPNNNFCLLMLQRTVM